jgi:hypothetical protein
MSSLGTFSLDLSKFATKAMGNADKVVKKACFDIGSDIQKATPKDTAPKPAGNGRSALSRLSNRLPGPMPVRQRRWFPDLL